MPQFQPGAPRTGGELLLNTIAQGIQRGKFNKSQKSNQAEMARILAAPGGNAGIMEAMKTSQNPQIQQMALMQALKTPKNAVKPFGGGEQGSLMYTAYTMPGTPEGQLAYEALKRPKTVRDASTGNVTEITQSIPPSLMKMYEGNNQAGGGSQGPAGNGTAPNVAGDGFEQVTDNVRVIEGYGKSATEGESKSIGFTNRMYDAENIYDDLVSTGFNPSGTETAFLEGLDEITPDIISQSAMPQDVKRYLGAKTDFITAVLRKESGAAIGQKRI